MVVTGDAHASFQPLFRTDDRAEILKLAVQASATVCTGRLDGMEPGPGNVRYDIVVDDVLKGAAVQGDTLDLHLIGEQGPYEVGDTLIWYVVECPDGTLFHYNWGLTDVVEGDSVLVSNPPSVESWTELREFLVSQVSETSLASISSAADLSIVGVVESINTGATWYDRIVVVDTSGTGQGHVTIHTRRPPLPVFPDIERGQEVLMFLKQELSGEWMTYGGAFGAWQVTGETATATVSRVGCFNTVALPIEDLME